MTCTATGSEQPLNRGPRPALGRGSFAFPGRRKESEEPLAFLTIPVYDGFMKKNTTPANTATVKLLMALLEECEYEMEKYEGGSSFDVAAERREQVLAALVEQGHA